METHAVYTTRRELSSALLLSYLNEKVCHATQLAIPSFPWTDFTMSSKGLRKHRLDGRQTFVETEIKYL